MIKRFIALVLMGILTLVVVNEGYKTKDALFFVSQKEDLIVEPIENHIELPVEPKIKPVELLEPILDSKIEPAKLLEPNLDKEIKPIELKKPIVEIETRRPNNEPRLP